MHINSIGRYRDPGEVFTAREPVFKTSYCFGALVKRN
jgi:hypothetical protein